LSLFPLLFLKYAGWEVMQRVYLFELPFVAYLSGVLFGINRKFALIGLALLIGIGSPLFIICRYGNQASDYFSDDYIAGSHYFDELKETTQYKIGPLRGVDIIDGEVVLKHYSGVGVVPYDCFPTEDHYYFAISEHDDAVYTYVYDKPDFVDEVWEWFRESPSVVSVYQNPEYEVFQWVGQ